MSDSYILLGGNLGNRAATLSKAIELIGLRAGSVVETSGIYETAAWGVEDQPTFLNQVVLLKTPLAPLELLWVLQKIELELGRKRHEKWHARTIDLDILFYENQLIDLPELKIPHPELHKRNFTLVPLHEIAPALYHPAKKATVSELLKNSPDKLYARIWSDR